MAHMGHCGTESGVPRQHRQTIRALAVVPWDVTVVDTLGNAYLQQSAITGASAAEANRGKYCSDGPTTFSQWLWKL